MDFPSSGRRSKKIFPHNVDADVSRASFSYYGAELLADKDGGEHETAFGASEELI